MTFNWKEYSNDIIVGSSTDPTEQLKKLTSNTMTRAKQDEKNRKSRERYAQDPQKVRDRVKTHYYKIRTNEPTTCTNKP